MLKPESIVKGIIGFTSSPLFLYLLLAALVIVGGRYLLHRIGIWRILPLLVLGLLFGFGCGVAEAGVMDLRSSPAMQCAVPVKPVMDTLMLVVLVISLFV